MREFEFTFDKGLQVGLRPLRLSRNQQALEVLQGARVGKGGLEPIEYLTPAYTHVPPETYPDISPDWPFPQYLRGTHRQLVGLRHTLYELLPAGTLLPVVIDVDGITSNDIWSMGDFGQHLVVMKDGSLIAQRNGETGLWSTHTSHTTLPNAKTICNFNGQGVVGNLSFATWAEANEGYIGWSNIGEVDFTIDRRGTAGYQHLGFAGEVYEVKPLGDGVMVYGSEGLGYLKAINSPMTTFGYARLARFGLANKGAVNGDEHSHCFVTNEGVVYKVNAEQGFPKLQVLGYEHLWDVERVIVVSFLPGSRSEGDGEYYISDGVNCYLLTPYGLSQTSQLITSAMRVGNTATGFFTQLAGAGFECVTSILDFNFRARKTISTIQVGCSGTGIYEVAVDYRFAPGEAFETTQYVVLNNQGIATLVCGGTEFRLRVAYDNPADIDISYIKVRYKADDLRGIRGMYAKG